MRRRTGADRPMIMDACVLIDCMNADRTLFKLVTQHVGTLHVTSAVLDEVDDIEDDNDVVELGLIIVEPDIEDAFTAARQSGPTSFQDRLCMLTAKRHGFTCVTNDRNLRTLCSREKVPTLWGLELVAELHGAGGISGKKAVKIAQIIKEYNPTHITAAIVSRFMERIRHQETKRMRND